MCERSFLGQVLHAALAAEEASPFRGAGCAFWLAGMLATLSKLDTVLGAAAAAGGLCADAGRLVMQSNTLAAVARFVAMLSLPAGCKALAWRIASRSPAVRGQAAQSHRPLTSVSTKVLACRVWSLV